MIAIGIPNGMEWLIILGVVLLLFGHRLPSMARSLGSGITEFKRGLKEGAQRDVGRDGSQGADGNSPPKNGDKPTGDGPPKS
ncbi:MAG: twin-arginine translocase TatA/TatE family subunit [Planctomycetes bacterium]|nr:twin-arginine translocase TatA/TatE family subunit [Planctomycetota bacterium]